MFSNTRQSLFQQFDSAASLIDLIAIVPFVIGIGHVLRRARRAAWGLWQHPARPLVGDRDIHDSRIWRYLSRYHYWENIRKYCGIISAPWYKRLFIFIRRGLGIIFGFGFGFGFGG